MAKTRALTRRVFVTRPRARHRAKPTIPLAIALAFVPAATRFIQNAKGEGIDYAGKRALEDFTGYRVEDGKWSLGMDHTARFGLWPVAAGIGIHMVASKLGVNRMIARAGIPLIRI